MTALEAVLHHYVVYIFFYCSAPAEYFFNSGSIKYIYAVHFLMNNCTETTNQFGGGWGGGFKQKTDTDLNTQTSVSSANLECSIKMGNTLLRDHGKNRQRQTLIALRLNRLPRGQMPLKHDKLSAEGVIRREGYTEDDQISCNE